MLQNGHFVRPREEVETSFYVGLWADKIAPLCEGHVVAPLKKLIEILTCKYNITESKVIEVSNYSDKK